MSNLNEEYFENDEVKKNLSLNLIKKTTNKTKRKKNNKRVLNEKERKSINIDLISHINWMIIILIFTFINVYNFKYVNEKCKSYKEIFYMFSRLISCLTAIETTSFFLIWFFLTKSKYYHMQIIYDTITGFHIFIAFINIIYAISTFLTRTCHENKLIISNDFNQKSIFDQLALKYDLKIAGAGHILLTTMIVISAIHLTTKRSNYFLNYLSRTGLITEYFWETID